MGYSLWGCTESDLTEPLTLPRFQFMQLFSRSEGWWHEFQAFCFVFTLNCFNSHKNHIPVT